jgi:hypothetical protein
LSRRVGIFAGEEKRNKVCDVVWVNVGIKQKIHIEGCDFGLKHFS